MGHRLDIVIPVHNEGRSIESSLEELCRTLTPRGRSDFRLIVCEDGSTDDTLQIIKELSATLPIKLVTAASRKGYSRAVIDGLAASDADCVAVIEGDGQSAPNAINILLDHINGSDLVVGWRNPRNDNILRKMLSGVFRSVYRRLFGVLLTDPSYACVLIRKPALRKVLSYISGRMPEGFFWEFNAWCRALNLRVREVSVPHRARAQGKTQIFRVWKLPAIGISQGAALFRLRREISAARRQLLRKMLPPENHSSRR
jgi:glycosyltransferase involved in cell wall biosynthesis